MKNDTINILLVEDNEGDIVLTLEAIKQTKAIKNVYVVKDGEEALLYLHKQKYFADVTTPDIIFLDINLPKIDGKEVLAEIKSDNKLKSIPVIMLTTSSSGEDIVDAYNHYANCYISKPIDFEKFREVLKVVEDFWSSIVQLPGHISN